MIFGVWRGALLVQSHCHCWHPVFLSLSPHSIDVRYHERCSSTPRITSKLNARTNVWRQTSYAHVCQWSSCILDNIISRVACMRSTHTHTHTIGMRRVSQWRSNMRIATPPMAPPLHIRLPSVCYVPMGESIWSALPRTTSRSCFASIFGVVFSFFLPFVTVAHCIFRIRLFLLWISGFYVARIIAACNANVLMYAVYSESLRKLFTNEFQRIERNVSPFQPDNSYGCCTLSEAFLVRSAASYDEIKWYFTRNRSMFTRFRYAVDAKWILFCSLDFDSIINALFRRTLWLFP